MTIARAQQYGVQTRTDAAFFLSGRGLLWSVQYHGTAAGTMSDNTGPGGGPMAVFFADPANTKATGTMLHYPQGMPFEIGIYLTGGDFATIVYTDLGNVSTTP